MKKTEKGMPGYLNYKRKIEIIRTLAYFGIVIAILLLGYFQTGTKLNLLTVVAIVGCVPASKVVVFLVFIRHRNAFLVVLHAFLIVRSMENERKKSRQKLIF